MKHTPADLLSRTFSTRLPRRKVRGRLRSQTQRRLGLVLSLILLYALLFLLQPALNRLTVGSSNVWLSGLALDARASLQGVKLAGWTLSLPVIQPTASAETTSNLLLHALAVAGLLLLTRRLHHRRPSAAWAMGCVLAIHGVSVIAMAAGAGHGFDLASHTLALSACMQLLLLCTPLVLVGGFFVLEPAWSRRLLASALLLSYLMMAGAFKLVGHAWLADLGGPVMLPTLFILFGPAFDVVALAGILSSLLAMPPQFSPARQASEHH